MRQPSWRNRTIAVHSSPCLVMAIAMSAPCPCCGRSKDPGVADCPGSVSWAPTFINLGKDYPDPSPFTAIVWGDACSNFSEPPESMFAGVGLCVRGTVVDYQDVPEIEVQDPNQVLRVDH
jgi:hypothetical protein